MSHDSLKFLYIVMISMCITACASGVAVQKNPFEVVVQVCLPNKRIYFDTIHVENIKNHPMFTKYSDQELAIAPNTIRRVASPDDTRLTKDPKGTREVWLAFTSVTRNKFTAGSVGQGVSIKDSTATGQPIYETTLWSPINDYVGLDVKLPMGSQEGNGINHYWFKLPGSISKEVFTDWYEPASMESDLEAHKRISIYDYVIHGENMPIYPVDVYSPKMRVKLMPHERHDNPVNDYLPAITTAKKNLETPKITSKFFLEFVPPEIEKIQSCD